MVIVTYTDGDGVALSFQPTTELQALLLADAHVRAVGYPHLSPLDIIRSANKGTGVVAGLFTGTKLTLKELLPGLRLRSGTSEIEIVRVQPTEREVTYKARNKYFKMDAGKFLDLANQQGYRKVWDLKTFLLTLKSMLKPILAAVPLMWVLKLVTNAVRRQPIKFESTIPRENEGKLSAPSWHRYEKKEHPDEHGALHHEYHQSKFEHKK